MAGKQTGCPQGMLDAAGIGAAFGLTGERVVVWAKKGRFPRPTMKMGRKLFWAESCVEEARAMFAGQVASYKTTQEVEQMEAA